ncbi:Stp1/IreP family PP2C-type Ser/Thr phosphatase [Parasporobacterium paucivorans]|uniref:Protein phosphatase 2C n=1 Tax=Parasporobacterium paucivorans DSM 15970 TaxID=1122934 RepID=A0A1M6ERM9_9FIRM|nr:Stp1/IreP family PP2C-type Ser/Thr phosphatase [Parasporobacterium paucivorans]SHI88154.1 Protein phosphatase 2C [Parasporobacterium paucivorans DSM 15970]
MKSAALTDKGLARITNQDYVYCSDAPVGNLPNLYVIADGMGGHKAGDFASSCAVNEFVKYIDKSENEDVARLMKNAIDAANRAVYESAADNPDLEGTGTTLVAATILDTTLFAANVGDSRLYVSNNELKQITRDHSLVEEMINNGGLDKESARINVNKNIITKAVGVSPVLDADFFEVEITEGDKVLLCSDGLTNMVEDSFIQNIIEVGYEPENIVELLVETANTNGGRDNISAILIQTD